MFAAGDADFPISICQAALFGHNLARTAHSSAAIQYNDDLAASAEFDAMNIAHNAQLYDFNLARLTAGSAARGNIQHGASYAHYFYTLADFMLVWYNTHSPQVCDYNFENGTSEANHIACNLFAFLHVSL